MPIIQSGTRFFEVNYPTPTSQPKEVLWTWTRVMIAAGWQPLQSSDGTTVSSGDWANASAAVQPNAWLRLKAPTGTMEFLVQGDGSTGSGAYGARAWLSDSAGFISGGTPSTAPTAADRVALIQGSTAHSIDIYFTWQAGLPTWHICADSAPYRGIYYFHIVGRETASPHYHRRVIVEPIMSVADGTVGSNDNAPYIWTQGGNSTNHRPIPGVVVTTEYSEGYYRRGLSGEAVTPLRLGTGPVHGNTSVSITNPYTGRISKFPLLAFRTGANAQDKGYTRNLRVCSMPLPERDTLDLAVAGQAMVVFDNVAIPWPHGVTPLP